MKKTSRILVLFLLMFSLFAPCSFFALCSCASDDLNIVPENDITYSHLQFGNIIQDDGTVAVFLNFDSDYAVIKMETEGALLDKNGNIIHSFDTTQNVGDPSNSPKTIVFIDVDLVQSVNSVSFTKIKAYTTEQLAVNGPNKPAAVVSVQYNYDAIIMSIFSVAFFASVIIIAVKANKSKDRQDADKEESKDNNTLEPKNEEDDKFDKFEEIKKYKELLDAGIITQEEFEAKKKELLG